MKTPRGLIFLCTFLLLMGIASTSLGNVSLDGAISSATADGVSSVNVAHTTGTGTDRLMMVGISANNYNTSRSISSVTFTPSGGSAINFTSVGSIENEAGRLSAIYRLVNPPSGVSGTVTVTFSGSVGYGIVVGVANFAGVNQSVPLDGFVSAVGTQTSAISIDVPTDPGDVVFDTVFLGAATLPSLAVASTVPSNTLLLGRPTSDSVAVNAILDQGGQVSFEYGTTSVGDGQSQQWNATIDRVRGVASIAQAATGTTQMSWTASGGSTSYYWAIGAVPINPASITPAAYDGTTAAVSCTAGEPVEEVIGGLLPDTRYYYRLRYRASPTDSWIAGNEYLFHTQRAKGDTFTFTITSDSHLGETFSGNSSDRYRQTTLNVASDSPDFCLDLGDAFVMSTANNQTDANNVYVAQRPYFGNYSHSAPVFLVIGNHENEEGWNLDDTPFSQGIGSIIARKIFFLNPIPDGFYSGNQDTWSPVDVGGDQHREDYYAWTWGDALFIVLDPFQYTMAKPYGDIQGSGEGTDDPQSGDQWNWTLGQTQYNWLKQTLETSHAKFKFVFSHHVLGGQLDVSGAAGTPGYVRGGAMAVPYFEWGGENADGSWGFDTKRPGWSMPIHQLMVANHVSAFFHGHDHQFVHEVRDGIVYQLVPAAGMTGNGFDLYTSSPYVVSGGNLSNAGHVRVRVNYPTADIATVDYVRSAISGDSGVTNGQISHTYTIEAASVSCQGDIQPGGGDGDVDGSDLAAYIGGSTGITLEDFADNFGRTDCM